MSRRTTSTARSKLLSRYVCSTRTYVGASQLKELTKRTTFIRVREQENNVYGKE